MISLQINIRVPGSDRFKNIGCWHGITFFKHKFWELQIYQSADILDLFFRFTRKQDHAGIHLGLGLVGFNAEFQIYDHRHWNKDTSDWEKYD